MALGVLQCPRHPHWVAVFWLLITITLITVVVGILVYWLSFNGEELSLASSLARLWLFLVCLPILALYINVLSPIDWVVVSNLLFNNFATKSFPRLSGIALHVSLLAASMSAGTRSLARVIADLVMEIKARRLLLPRRRINTLLSLLTVFLTDMLRIAMDFHDEWALRFCPNDNKLADLKHPWSFLDAVAALAVIALLMTCRQ